MNATTTSNAGSGDVAERNKATVRALVEQVITGGRLEFIEQLYAPDQAEAARSWIAPFRRAFPDVVMEIIELVAEGDTVAGRFTCSATHHGGWLAHPGTGRRFDHIAEVGFYRLHHGRITDWWTLEDTHTRLRQLGLTDPAAAP